MSFFLLLLGNLINLFLWFLLYANNFSNFLSLKVSYPFFKFNRVTVFDDSLMQALKSCPHHHKKSSEHGDSHSKYYGHGIGFKIHISSSIFVKTIQISSSLLPKDSQIMLVDSEGKHISETVEGQFIGHQCICGKGYNPHSNLVCWKFDPPLPLQGKKEYIGRVRHSNTDSQLETIKEVFEGVTISGQITASPFKLDFFKH